MIANGNTYCKIASFGPVLPTEYQEVEYIESTGTQYIDTNTTIKNGTIYDIKVQITQLQETAPSGGENFFIGTMSANNTQYTLRCLVYGNNIIIQRGQFAVSGVVSIPKDTNWHTYYSSKTLCKIDNTTGVPSYTITDNDLKIFLFKQNRDGYANQNSYCRIAYCKIWDDTTLVRNFIPCYRISDNEIGMYDTVNKVFYTNQGTGTFLKGNNVVHTIKYKIPTEERPYISGHVTDGSSTFTFTVNTNQSVTVPVDSNGNWKWMIDRQITSFVNTFRQKNTVDTIKINYRDNAVNCYNMAYLNTGVSVFVFNTPVSNGNASFATNKNEVHLKTITATIDESCTNLGYFVRGQSVLEELILKGDTSNVTKYEYFLRFCSSLKTLKIPTVASGSDINSNYVLTDAINIENVEIKTVLMSISFKNQSKLTKQSVLNIINAAEANVTYTLHSTVYNKCASGGEWYTDIQAAIDAKALEGYTVTLISA